MKFYQVIALCAAFVFFTAQLAAQEVTINFGYDAAGNMTQRSIQVMMGGRFSGPPTKKDSLQRPFNVFPNPTNQYLNIEGPLPENTNSGELILLNVNGQVVKKDVYTGQAKSLPVSDLKPGMYLLEIQYSKKQKSTYKIIINN